MWTESQTRTKGEHKSDEEVLKNHIKDAHLSIDAFSLMMFSDKMQSPSKISTVPEGPYLLKLHFATFGKTLLRGSSLRSGSCWLIASTSLP